MSKLKISNPVLLITAFCFFTGCTSTKFYEGRELPKAYIAQLNWDLKQTKKGVFVHIDKIDGRSTGLNSEAWVKPGVHLIEYSCMAPNWADHFPDTALIEVRAGFRYGFLFSGFAGSPYPHPHPECDLGSATPPCIAQELAYISKPTPCKYNMVEKAWPQAEFSQPMPINLGVLLSVTPGPWQDSNLCNLKDQRACDLFHLGRTH